jgi:hypothetical protein
MRVEVANWVKSDPDLDTIRDNPRFRAMLASAEARLAQSHNRNRRENRTTRIGHPDSAAVRVEP